MMRCFLAVVFAVLVTAALPHRAEAQCTNGLITNCPYANTPQADDVLLGWQSGQNPHTRKFPLGNISGNTFAPWLLATAYGVKADGTTSDDRALGRALYACSQAGATLVLPPGRILLTGAALVGTETRTIQNCAIQGAGVISNNSTPTTNGTTISPTSTTVKPFIIGSGWTMSGVNFYWPNQITGTTVYPPLFSDAGSTSFHWAMDRVTIVNAYIGFSQTTGVDWGDMKISNSTMYAVKALFKTCCLGDAWYMSNNLFDPGPWLATNPTNAYTGINGAVSGGNMLFEVTNGSGGSTGMNVSKSGAFGWRYGVFVEAGGVWAADMDIDWDGTGTVVDASSGGVYAPQSQMTGHITNCFILVYSGTTPTSTGSPPCFNMGSASAIYLRGYYGASRGDFITTAGSNVTLIGSQIDAVGIAADGGEYSVVHVTAGAPALIIQDNVTNGILNNAHVHGLRLTSAPVKLVVQNNSFSYFQDDITGSLPAATTLTGNYSGATVGSASLVMSTTNTMIYANNFWDKPPLATVSDCSGSDATITGTMNGYITVGTTPASFTTCSLHLPINPITLGGGSCTFAAATAAFIWGGVSGTPPVWIVRASADIHGSQIFYNCSAQQ